MSFLEKSQINLSEAITQHLNLTEISSKLCKADVLRLDKIHPVISGNKFFKLKYNIQTALSHNHNTILTFGGAYSNHIIATALAAQQAGLKSIGIIRGEAPKELSHTLKSAQDYGMKLEFINRNDFKNRNDKNFVSSLTEKFGNFYLVPEGGASAEGRRGSKEILELTDYKKYSHIMCAIGTGTMYMGLVNSSELAQQMIGIPVLKGLDDLMEEFKPLLENPQKINYCKIIYDYHFGGYAKKTPELLQFMNDFYNKTSIPSDFVYTGKLIYAFFDLLKNNYFTEGNHILIIHSGGLQGNLSLNKDILFY